MAPLLFPLRVRLPRPRGGVVTDTPSGRNFVPILRTPQFYRRASVRLGVTLALLVAPTPSRPAAQAQEDDLRGLWEATLRFGPDVHGDLLLLQTADGWHADVCGFSVPAQVKDETFTFALPDGKGTFRGKREGSEIAGQWIQPSSKVTGASLATPVSLQSDGPDRWRGTIVPFEDRFTWYMPVVAESNGGLRTYLRNPERNQGRFLRVSGIQRVGDEVRLLRGGSDAPVVTGRVEEGTITMSLRGGTYDFTKAEDTASHPFYPRGNPPPRYTYSPPPAGDDGWPVGSAEEVGISEEAMERFVQMLIDLPMDSINTPQIHSVLIARHGRLVVEEYFHGFHRDLPHETRSASKSWTATLIGAAMQSGIPLRMESPVYATMLGQIPDDLDPLKRSMTLGHLMSMSAGFNCDPDDTTSADEDVMDERGIEDWYGYTLSVPLVSAPGEKLFYCSTEANLAGGMLAAIAHEPLAELFYRLVARPLEMQAYHLQLQRSGEAYGGGGHKFTPRDFLKMAQLLVDGGSWKGTRILPPNWLEQMTASLRDLSSTQQYACLWNSVEYSHENRKVRTYFAGGNGGQIFMAIPELDIAIGFTGGNYADAATFTAQRVYIPNFILPAVRDDG